MALPQPTYHIHDYIEFGGKRLRVPLSGPFRTEGEARAALQKQRTVNPNAAVWQEQILLDEDEENGNASLRCRKDGEG